MEEDIGHTDWRTTGLSLDIEVVPSDLSDISDDFSFTLIIAFTMFTQVL